MPTPMTADHLGRARELIGRPLGQHPRARQIREGGLPTKGAQILLDATPDLIATAAGLCVRRCHEAKVEPKIGGTQMAATPARAQPLGTYHRRRQASLEQLQILQSHQVRG